MNMAPAINVTVITIASIEGALLLVADGRDRDRWEEALACT